jgi:hypothetical protein
MPQHVQIADAKENKSFLFSRKEIRKKGMHALGSVHPKTTRMQTLCGKREELSKMPKKTAGRKRNESTVLLVNNQRGRSLNHGR